MIVLQSKHWPPAPFLLMLITSAADFLLYFFLVPETRGKKLPDNMPGEEHNLHENHTQDTESAKDVKIDGQESAPPSTSRQGEKSTKRETEKKRDEKESSNDERKMEEKKKEKENEGNVEKMEEKKESEAQQKSTEGSKQEQKSKTESSGNEARKEK